MKRPATTRTFGVMGAPSASTGPLALMWSGGKDSALALHRALAGGLPVAMLVTFVDEASGRVRFHHTRLPLLETQARALRLPLRAHATTPERYEATFSAAVHAVAAQGLSGIVFGNIHLADVRSWFEDRVRAAGLAHIEPLWGERTTALLEEAVAAGIRAVITCRDTTRLDASWLGRVLDADAVRDLLALPDVDACGERGEYHTFVFDGPGFARPVAWQPGARHTDGAFELLDLVPLDRPGGQS